ncbi:uncharacterized protein LOC127761178 [Oryza glaberrima]|uniref:uncharacterized protein LOC127761178 n=1 Tax=Oryza glaberrima TaxID=4538 RepID=UPI00224C1860|nr:uncharacterized protein LOC127761178 [Oryza glaberrima]
MAKPSPAAVHTPRPASIRSTRASVGSSSTPRPPIPAAAANSKGVAKCLAFHDGDFTFPDDLAPLLDLPDPADSSSTTTTSALISAAPDPDDAITASADSALTEVTAPAETTAMVDEEEEEEEPLPDQISLALAELRGGRGLSPRSKRLVAALVEAAAAELRPTATTLRLRRAAFWVKVRVWILAATVATVFAIDVALAVALVSRCGNDLYDALPPT